MKMFRPDTVPTGCDLEPPPFWSSKMAAKTLGESKKGTQNQSIEPFMPTSAAVRMLPMMP
jgi:hypothetical protein